ncbi:hypothetical protein CEN40_12150 [Fischerella thermalis CCMEE 5205]|nr:hypothetical protein CEN40_12150 [Fischerella thermalis CCMEE 5205]
MRGKTLTTNNQQPTTNHQQPTINNQPYGLSLKPAPTTNHQQSTINNQQSTTNQNTYSSAKIL